MKRGSSLSRSQLLASLSDFERTIIELLREGNTVTTPLLNISFSISGVFNGPMDLFDRLRHKLNININAGTLLRSLQKQIKLEKTNMPALPLRILKVTDTVSDSSNEVLTPSGVLAVYGTDIKIEGNEPTCGLYFVNSAGEETKATTIAHNKPSTVIVMVPDLAPGVYRVKIVTQYNHHAQTKVTNTYTFARDLSVG